jgi:quercetin dioxygenase-like cupin family protein
MRQIAPIAVALLLVTCGGAPQAASSPTPPASASTTVAAVATPIATPIPTYAPSAEGFTSKVLIEKPRDLSTSATGYVWIVAGATTDARGVSAVVSEKESFTASYQAPTDRHATDGEKLAYATPDLPPLAAGRYTEGLRLVVVQPGGRSAAHMHSGIEGVLVLEGRVLVRSGGNAPTFLEVGQGFYILPKVPVQLINAGNALARTLVYSITPEGAPFSTELAQSP